MFVNINFTFLFQISDGMLHFIFHKAQQKGFSLQNLVVVHICILILIFKKSL